MHYSTESDKINTLNEFVRNQICLWKSCLKILANVFSLLWLMQFKKSSNKSNKRENTNN